mgnify:CR=1 FL=1
MPISFLMNQPSLRDSHVDTSGLLEFLASCPEYALSSDSSLVRLAIPMNRHTIILRNVPEEATEEDILRLVNNPVVNLRREVGSVWFLDYPTESSALEAIDRLQSSTLLGSPVRARVKGAMYMKELYKQINARAPDRRLSTDAEAFTPESVSKKLSMDSIANPSMNTTANSSMNTTANSSMNTTANSSMNTTANSSINTTNPSINTTNPSINTTNPSINTSESPSRKLSSDAAEFTPTHRMSVDASPFVPSATPSAFLWGYPGLSNGLEFA